MSGMAATYACGASICGSSVGFGGRLQAPQAKRGWEDLSYVLYGVAWSDSCPYSLPLYTQVVMHNTIIYNRRYPPPGLPPWAVSICPDTLVAFCVAGISCHP